MKSSRVRWRPSAVSWAIVLIGALGLGTLLYPSAAQWLTSYNQSKLMQHDHAAPSGAARTDSEATAQLEAAHRYNAALTSGVLVAANENVPSGTGLSTDPSLAYDSMLHSGSNGRMARLRYSNVGVDLPVYHGTDEATLLRGAGHLEGSSLPVGGENTHAVITAHRGLAEATMFTNLDRAEVGDTFVLEVLGEALTYQVRDVTVVAPDQTERLRVIPGKDLVTLVTCTPLGINSHRILVTAERVLPTPLADIQNVGLPSDVPGPPWWLAVLSLGIVALTAFLWRSGRSDAHPLRGPRHAA